MKITLPKALTLIKWKGIALAASVLCSIAELSNIQRAEKSGYIAAASQQKIEIAKLSLSMAADTRLLASKTNKSQGIGKYQHIYSRNICKVERLLEQSTQSSSTNPLPNKNCSTTHYRTLAEITLLENQLASKIDTWENDTKAAATKQTQHTSTALQLNYLATMLLLLFLALDLFDTYGTSRD